MKPKNVLCSLAMTVVLHFSVLAGSAQTYIYSYTGNDFTHASAPYTTSDKIAANLVLSAPLGDNYEGSPADLIQSFSLSDGVNELVSGSPGVPVQLLAGSFETDSAGVIVGWDFGAQSLPGLRSTNPPVFIQTMTFPFVTNVVDQASIGMPPGEFSAFVQNAPGEWVETIVPEPSVGLLFASSAALLFGIRAVQRWFRMKSKNILCGLAIAAVWQLGLLAGSAQTNIFTYTGYETNITLAAGTYIITAYGASGGFAANEEGHVLGGGGAEMSAEFNFSTPATLTLLVGGIGGYGNYEPDSNGGGGGGGSFVVEGNTPLVIAGGGGGAAAGGGLFAAGGNGNITTNGSAGGGNVGGSGGTAGAGGTGAYVVVGSGGNGVPGGGAGGGGGFYGGGGIGHYVYYGVALGGSSFEGGGAGGLSNLGFGGVAGYLYGDGGFGGGGGSFISPTYVCGGGGGGYSGGGGGGVVPYDSFGAGGGGGSIIDSSAIAILAEVSAIRGPRNYGEIIITAVPIPLAIITSDAAFGFTNGAFGFNLIGPVGSYVVIQASADLQNWIPLQTNLFGNGPLYFSDPQSTTNVQRFYRAVCAYTVSGTLTGLPVGDTVTLQDNGSDNLTLSANGPFTFPTALPDGHAYSITVRGIFFGGLTPTTCTLTNGNGTISGANATNVLVQCSTFITGNYLPLTGNPDVDMLNAAVADGTAHGGVPGVMDTENGGPFLVTANAQYSHRACLVYPTWARIAITVGSDSCSSTTFPSGTSVIQFGTALACGVDDLYGY